MVDFDIMTILLGSLVLIVFTGALGLGLVLVLFAQDIEQLPKRFYTIKLFHMDNKTEKPFSVPFKTVKGWTVTRKGGVKYLRLGFGGIMQGVDVDIGYLRSMVISDSEEYVELMERIPGIKNPRNYSPLKVPFEVDSNLERSLKQQSTYIHQYAARLPDSPEKEKILMLINGLSANVDKVVDMDRRQQAAQVSDWVAFESTGIEKNAYRVKRDDPLEKYLPYIGLALVAVVILGSVIFISNMFIDTTKNATAQIQGACNNAAGMYTVCAQSCGWVPPNTNTSKELVKPPSGIAIPGLS